MELELALPRSPSGKVYQYSPVNYASPRLFLIGDAPVNRVIAEEHQDRLRRNPGPGKTVCPYSGHVADDDDFVHFEDIEAIEAQVTQAVEDDLQDHLADMAQEFNRGQPRGGLVELRMEVSRPPRRRQRPLTIRQDLLRDLECDVCQRAYAVYAIALYCPDCGSPNASLHFNREIELVHEQIALADAQNYDGRSELAFRLMGNAHEDVVTAFETTLKTMYRQLVRLRASDRTENLLSNIGNAFQNVERTQQKFADLGVSPFVALKDEELEQLRVNIQKRHVIGHNLSMADDRFRELAQAQVSGSTVSLVGEEVAEFANTCLKVVKTVETPMVLETN
jgi:hypothetical protein